MTAGILQPTGEETRRLGNDPSSIAPSELLPCKAGLFPYTTLFRSHGQAGRQPGVAPPPLAGPLPDRRVLGVRSEAHTSELQSPDHLVCRLLLEKKNQHVHISLYDAMLSTLSIPAGILHATED